MLKRLLLMLFVVVPLIVVAIGMADLLAREGSIRSLWPRTEAALAVFLLYGLPGALLVSILHSIGERSHLFRTAQRSLALALGLGFIAGTLTAAVLVPSLRLHSIIWGSLLGLVYGVLVIAYGRWRPTHS